MFRPTTKKENGRLLRFPSKYNGLAFIQVARTILRREPSCAQERAALASFVMQVLSL
jgi:hypothetical protein